MMVILPTIDGYTMDRRLKEFRKVSFKNGNPSIEFVPFHTMKGRRMLKDVI
jgi:hypothetical protein